MAVLPAARFEPRDPRRDGLRVWRIVAARWAERAFDGEGARRYGGRWNHPGVAVAYASEHLSLAALELFVGVDADDAPADWVAIPARLPSGLEIPEIRPDRLAPGWRRYPAPERLRDLGTAALRGSLALAVPSAVIPWERNVLIDPGHPRFAELRIGSPEPFSFDSRMWEP